MDGWWAGREMDGFGQVEKDWLWVVALKVPGRYMCDSFAWIFKDDHACMEIRNVDYVRTGTLEYLKRKTCSKVLRRYVTAWFTIMMKQKKMVWLSLLIYNACGTSH